MQPHRHMAGSELVPRWWLWNVTIPFPLLSWTPVVAGRCSYSIILGGHRKPALRLAH